MQIRRILTLLTIGLSFLVISCSASTGGDESDPNAGKTEIDYEVFVTHLLTEDSNIFTKNNVIVTAIYDDGSTGTVTDFTIEPASFEVTVGNGTEFTFKRGNDSKIYKAFKAGQELSSEPTKNGETTITFGYFAKSKLESTTGMTFSAEPARNGWYIGSDGKYYGKAGDDYYKVEPIEWDIYTDKFNNSNCYKAGSKILLVAKDIIYGGIPYSETKAELTRTINGKTVYANSYVYSNLRAFFNGYDYILDDETTSDKYKVQNFLNMAFTNTSRNKILTTVVKTDGESSNDISNSGWSRIDGTVGNDTDNYKPLDNDSGSPDITEPDVSDKVFALSIYDYNNLTYGWSKGGNGSDPSLKKKPTDYAKAMGVAVDANGFAKYMERTPHYKTSKKPLYERTVDEEGYTYISKPISDSTVGIVPAIVINPLN